MTDNELIAEFMGFKKDAAGLYLMHIHAAGRHSSLFRPDQVAYNTSWDWLMPVVEKIAKIETKDTVRNGEDSYFDSYFPRTFGMINSETKEFMVRINRNPLYQSDSLIKATHEAVVEFIKWYNQNK